MGLWRRWLAAYGLNAAIVLAAAVCAIATVSDPDTDVDGIKLWFEAAWLAGVVLVLLLRRSFPFAAPATLWLGSAALSFVDGELVSSQPAVFIAGLCAAFLIGNLRNGRQAGLGLAIVVGAGAVVVWNDPSHRVGNFFFVPVQFALAWVVGYALRERTERTEAAEERAARAELERETASRVAIAEERARIAREMHDVVAHAVSVMLLQVGAVRHRMPSEDVENREALSNVEKSGRAALSEMRRLLGALRDRDEPAQLTPQPGLNQLDALLQDVRASGLDVTVQLTGHPVPLPSGLDLSAYRIIQEALTNTLKHAHAHSAEVTVHFGKDDLQLTICDDGSGQTTGSAVGHGLVGMRERVKIYGGQVSAGPSPTGGYEVRVQLPLEPQRETSQQ